MPANLEQSLRARAVLRQAAGLGPETFQDHELVNMLSDEIRALREKGTSDEAISKMLSEGAGIDLSAEALRSYTQSEVSQKRAA